MTISPVNGEGKIYHAHAAPKECANYLLNMLNTPNNPHALADQSSKPKPIAIKKEDKSIDLEALYYDLLKRVIALEKKR